MKLRATLLLCSVTAISFIIIYLIPIWNTPKLSLQQMDQDEQQNGRRREWTHKTMDGVELWVAWQEVTHPPDGEWLHIYALMEGQYFNEETLRQLFTKMSEEYSKYKYLDVNIYSDEEELTRRVDKARYSYKIHADPPSGKPKEEKAPRNYFDAYYYRAARTDGLQADWFSYTPDPTKDDTIKITLKP